MTYLSRRVYRAVTLATALAALAVILFQVGSRKSPELDAEAEPPQQ